MKKAHIYAIPAIGAALIAVLAQISLPIGPVPFTLQNFAIGLIATVFRPREAVLSVALYLLLGAIGPCLCRTYILSHSSKQWLHSHFPSQSLG